jgi:hypothetical protein
MTSHASGSRRRRWLFLGILGAMGLIWAAGSDRPVAHRALDTSSGILASGAGELPAVDGRLRLPEQSVGTNQAKLLAGIPAAGDLAPATHLALKPVAGDKVPEALESPIARALRAIDECQARYDRIRDYVCTFSKRERVNGRLTPPHVMLMKARTRPRSVYLKFREPAAGREAIYIEGRHDGKVLAHDVGLGRLIAGTLRLDPTGPRAMEDCRHPITEAGIGPLLDTLEARWTAELNSSESRVDFRDAQLAVSRPCTRIDVTHSRQDPDFLFYQVHLYIDRDLGLPIRFEAYDWPVSPEAAPALVEEYTYSDLKLNVGLGDIDFDISNEDYAFGRF